MGNKSVISCKHDKTIQEMRKRIELSKKEILFIHLFFKMPKKGLKIFLNNLEIYEDAVERARRNIEQKGCLEYHSYNMLVSNRMSTGLCKFFSALSYVMENDSCITLQKIEDYMEEQLKPYNFCPYFRKTLQSQALLKVNSRLFSEIYDERVEFIKKLRNDIESVTFFEKVKLKLKSIWLNL
jgi:hypothetical protein